LGFSFDITLKILTSYSSPPKGRCPERYTEKAKVFDPIRSKLATILSAQTNIWAREIQKLLAWTEDEFVQRLPDLRLAFAGPRRLAAHGALRDQRRGYESPRCSMKIGGLLTRIPRGGSNTLNVMRLLERSRIAVTIQHQFSPCERGNRQPSEGEKQRRGKDRLPPP